MNIDDLIDEIIEAVIENCGVFNEKTSDGVGREYYEQRIEPNKECVDKVRAIIEPHLATEKEKP